ncbi:NADH dehydrogenase [ubiquinone] 1 alpha subcomplex assembly factor 4 [Pelobates fuscus]|uniref:NADH dehydrogenase [ubiquinone] 1 alpha subcomplex assembly factor 4 n=1 Tax=Pelobates fuscus TaxID=191477 RepID=UPI002FE48757
MGARISRVFRDFNIENRAHRLIGKDKVRAAPPHPGTREAQQAQIEKHPEIQEAVYKKDDKLLLRLKEVYVDSTDPSLQVKSEDEPLSVQEEFRLPKLTMGSNQFSVVDVKDIPKGKISILEALTALHNHKQNPQIWTSEKIAKEYNLDIKDCQSLLEYFIPFDMKIFPRQDTKDVTET